MSSLAQRLSFFKKKEFWLALLLLVLVFFIFFFLFFGVFLRLYTKHGKSVEVPEVTRLAVADGTTQLEAIGLRVEISDSLYDPKQKPLTIISQIPKAHDRVKPGRPVFLTINKVVPPTVAFPTDVEYTSVYQAKLRLESWKLGVEKIRTVPSEYRDLVLSIEWKGKKVKEGDMIPQGTQLVLVVGKGTGNEKVAVACFDGKDFSEAISELHGAGLNFDLQFKPESKEEKGSVIGQYPKCTSGDSVSLGTQITLIIAGREPEEVEEMIPTE
jgi:eukaryotic-like serine/threonine-protein kinase